MGDFMTYRSSADSAGASSVRGSTAGSGSCTAAEEPAGSRVRCQGVSALHANPRAVLFHLKLSHLALNQEVDELLDLFQSPNLLASRDAARWFLSSHWHDSPIHPVIVSETLALSCYFTIHWSLGAGVSTSGPAGPTKMVSSMRIPPHPSK